MVNLDAFGSAGEIFSKGAGNLFGNYGWYFLGFVILGFVGFIIYMISLWRRKKAQWTHKIKIRRALPQGMIKDQHGKLIEQKPRLSEPFYLNMRRFPLVKNAEVFELEKPLLGSYLCPELEEYSDMNEFSIIIDLNNRIYLNKGEYFDRDKSCVNVSGKHAEIDLGISDLKSDFQDINKTRKVVDWGTIAKMAILGIFIIACMIVLITGLQNWGEAKKSEVAKAQAEAEMAKSMSEAISTMQSVVNTQKLEITYMLQELYGTKNIQSIVNRRINETSTD